jgi:hypothetical protein
MTLSAQISLIDNPQEFVRLCNAVLQADRGDDFLPIDDDRADRGNDGYLKSERRLFAVHCFKRVQNRGVESAIRGKMVGDLGKAIVLKHEGIWDVEAWTFLSNYPIPESIAKEVIRLGGEAAIDVTWRGSEFIADVLQRHPEVRVQFPQLQINEVSHQLAGLRSAVERLLNQKAKDDQLTIEGIPENAEEQRALLATQPPVWEYRLFAGILKQGKQALELRWRDNQLGITRLPARDVDLGEAMDYLTNSFPRLSEISGRLTTRVFDKDAQEQTFGAPGEPGDPDRIEHFAKHILAGYEEMLDWAASMRSVRPPELLKRAFELAGYAADRPMSDIRTFIDDLATDIARVQEHVAREDPTPLHVTSSLVLTADDELIEEFGAELQRATDHLSDS